MQTGTNAHVDARILGFDGIRGLAVILVVLDHLDVTSGSERIFKLLNGGTGVQAFFVLSGFLITMLLIREYEKKGSISFRSFYLRRFLRISPAYVILLICVSSLVLLGYDVAKPEALVAAWVYMTNFVPVVWYSPVLAHTWSLAVEEHFYVVWPALFLVLIRRGYRQTLIAILLLVAASVAAYWFLEDVWRWYYRIKVLFHLERWTMISGANICLGAAGAVLLTGRNTKQMVKRWFGTASSGVLGVFLLIVTAYIESRIAVFYLRGLALAILLFWLYLNQVSLVVKALEWRPLRYVGQISYGIYLYQGLFLGTELRRAADQAWPPSPEIGLALLLIVAPLSFHWFEKPMMNLRPRLQRALPGVTSKQMSSPTD